MDGLAGRGLGEETKMTMVLRSCEGRVRTRANRQLQMLITSLVQDRLTATARLVVALGDASYMYPVCSLPRWIRVVVFLAIELGPGLAPRSSDYAEPQRTGRIASLASCCGLARTCRPPEEANDLGQRGGSVARRTASPHKSTRRLLHRHRGGSLTAPLGTAKKCRVPGSLY